MITKAYLFATLSLLLLNYVHSQVDCQAKNQCVNPKKAINPSDYFCIGIGKYRMMQEENYCVKHTCVQVEEDGKDVIKIEKTYACKTPTGLCLADGLKWKDREVCATYQCVVTSADGKHHMDLKIVKRECPNPLYTPGSGQYRCIGENRSVRSAAKCKKYTCSSGTDDDGKPIMRIQQSFYGCRYQEKCFAIGETSKENCLTRECQVTDEGRKSVMANTVLECKDNVDGECHEAGSSVPYMHEGNMFECTCNINGDPPSFSSELADCKFLRSYKGK